jgi:hypothetical protein
MVEALRDKLRELLVSRNNNALFYLANVTCSESLYSELIMNRNMNNK